MEPSSLAQALTVLGASLVLAKLLEEGAIKLRLPGVLGQILAGIILGSSFSYFRQAYNGDALEFLMNLGLIWLLFLGGLETDISLVRRTGKVAVVSTTMGVLVPLILGFLVGRLLGLPGREPLVLGILLTPTSIGLTLRVFIELGKLNTDYGIASLTASILDDFMGIALLVLGVARG
ncbi:MAG TPA: cation:proton antiporter, partial [Aciduliprofundum sp.]|nr:cation:proton antiporter [Aciduliprofundum sp.]